MDLFDIHVIVSDALNTSFSKKYSYKEFGCDVWEWRNGNGNLHRYGGPAFVVRGNNGVREEWWCDGVKIADSKKK